MLLMPWSSTQLWDKFSKGQSKAGYALRRDQEKTMLADEGLERASA